MQDHAWIKFVLNPVLKWRQSQNQAESGSGSKSVWNLGQNRTKLKKEAGTKPDQFFWIKSVKIPAQTLSTDLKQELDPASFWIYYDSFFPALSTDLEHDFLFWFCFGFVLASSCLWSRFGADLDIFYTGLIQIRPGCSGLTTIWNSFNPKADSF